MLGSCSTLSWQHARASAPPELLQSVTNSSGQPALDPVRENQSLISGGSERVSFMDGEADFDALPKPASERCEFDRGATSRYACAGERAAPQLGSVEAMNRSPEG